MSTVQDALDTLRITKKENIEIGTVARYETAEGNVLSEKEQWDKLRLVVDVADEVWG